MIMLPSFGENALRYIHSKLTKAVEWPPEQTDTKDSDTEDSKDTVSTDKN